MPLEYIPSRPAGRPEFGDVFGGWLTESAGRTFLVDTGLGSGAADMVERLKARLGGRNLDCVLLTHIHLDHAGGLGEIFRTWPETLAVVHEKGRRHLAEPDRLWLKTREVMGELAEVYGRPASLDPSRLIPHREADWPGLTILETPGHASHHLSFRLENTWFVGEAGGCPYLWEGRCYTRPATPPPFRLEIALASIDRLLREPDGRACFAHTPEKLTLKAVLEAGRRQLAFWNDLLKPRVVPRPGESREARLDRLTGLVLREDPELRPITAMPPAVQWRERLFIRNSVEGFLEHFKV